MSPLDMEGTSKGIECRGVVVVTQDPENGTTLGQFQASQGDKTVKLFAICHDCIVD